MKLNPLGVGKIRPKSERIRKKKIEHIADFRCVNGSV